jgi:hypothetical protein
MGDVPRAWWDTLTNLNGLAVGKLGIANGSGVIGTPARAFFPGAFAGSRYSAIELPPELLYNFPHIVSVFFEIAPNLFEIRGSVSFLGWRGSSSTMA